MSHDETRVDARSIQLIDRTDRAVPSHEHLVPARRSTEFREPTPVQRREPVGFRSEVTEVSMFRLRDPRSGDPEPEVLSHLWNPHGFKVHGPTMTIGWKAAPIDGDLQSS